MPAVHRGSLCMALVAVFCATGVAVGGLQLPQADSLRFVDSLQMPTIGSCEEGSAGKWLARDLRRVNVVSMPS